MSTALKQMTVDEFLLWAEGEEGRWELHDGVPRDDFAGARRLTPRRRQRRSSRFKCRFTARAGCRARSSGWHGDPDRRADDLRTRRIGCLRPSAPPDAIEIDNPVIVVEVLSPSTAAIDHGRKLSGYFSLASVQHYLILDPDRRVVIHHKRGSGDAIETRVLTDGVARLDPPGFEVAVEALFPPA